MNFICDSLTSVLNCTIVTSSSLLEDMLQATEPKHIVKCITWMTVLSAAKMLLPSKNGLKSKLRASNLLGKHAPNPPLQSCVLMHVHSQSCVPQSQVFSDTTYTHTKEPCSKPETRNEVNVYTITLTIASFPGRSRLQFLHTASDQKLEAGTAWERG